MLKKNLFAPTLFLPGVAFVRMVAGLLVCIHGMGIFNPAHMQGNIAWLNDVGFPGATLMAYVGKGSELLGGLCLFLGFLTRAFCLLLFGTMSVITFVLGKGKIWEDDQLPFLFLLFSLLFFFMGGGRYSLDNRLFGKKDTYI